MIWKFPRYEIDQTVNWELLKESYSWLNDMQGVPQNPIWHGEGDVYVHTTWVVRDLLNLSEFQELSEQDKHILFAAALLHDVEKRSTTVTEVIDGIESIVSPRHALRGEYTARTILYKDIPTPFHIREQIAKLVRHHGLPLFAISKDDPRKSVIEVSLKVNTLHLYILAKADIKGRICPDQEEELMKVELFKELCLDYNCFGKPHEFKSNYGRYLYLNRDEIAPDYEPFEDHKFTVTLLSALPGTGKDTYLKKLIHQPVLSLDEIRRKHGISPTDKKKNGQVIQLAKEQAKAWMRARQSFVFNATNITRDMRSKWIGLFTEYKARVKIVYLEVPHTILMRQNKNRMHVVPEKVIDKMISRLEIPSHQEAHDLEFLINKVPPKRDKKKEFN